MPMARSGKQLPNARTLSTRLFYDRPVSSRVMTHMNMQWGQFVTHDMVFQVMEVTGKRNYYNVIFREQCKVYCKVFAYI